MKYDLVVYSTETLDSHPSVGLIFADKLYVFNVPDQTQRVFFETKLRYVKLAHIFLTSLKARSLGGFHGLTITAYNTKNNVLSYSAMPGFQVILESYARLHTCDKLRPQMIENYHDNNLSVQNIYLSQSVAYEVKLPDIPGKFLANKARELGLSPGPLFKVLASGKSVTNPEGKEITPEMVLSPPTPGDEIFFVDCQNLEDISMLPDCSKYSMVIHFTKLDLLMTPEYLSHFNPSSQKCICFPPSGQITFQSVAYLYAASAALAQPLLTPLVCYEDNIKEVSKANEEDCIIIPDDYIVAVPEMLYQFAPVEKRRFIYPDEIHQKDGTDKNKTKLLSILESFSKEAEKTLNFDCGFAPSVPLPKPKPFAITFLGTGSMFPSKYRNVTGIVLHTSSGFIILDPGEGFAGQLRRRYGKENFETIMRNLLFIWISHLHGDHHFGLYQLLQERAELEKIPPIPLLCHSLIKNHMENFERLTGPLKFVYHSQTDGFELKSQIRKQQEEPIHRDMTKTETFSVGNVSITSIPVSHCVDSLGCLLSLDGGWKVAFSGDRNNTDRFAEIVNACDLLIHEATFTDELSDTAKEKGHSTIGQALDTGNAIKATYTILTHFSQRYPKLPVFSAESLENIAFAFDYLSINYESMSQLCKVCPQIFQMIQDLEATDEKDDES